MSGANASGSTRTQYPYGDSIHGRGWTGWQPYYDEIEPEVDEYYTPNESLLNANTADSSGIKHRETISDTAPNTMRMTFHAIH